MYIVATYFTTEFHRLLARWERQKKGLAVDHTDRVKNGCIVLINWESKQIEKLHMLGGPSYSAQRDDEVVVADSEENSIFVLDKETFSVKSEIRHKSFNDLHSLIKYEDKYTVTSTGVGNILEISENGDVVYEWRGVDHGYIQDSRGEVFLFDENKDYSSEIIPTINQTTHINYAVRVSRNEIIASLFHQGELIKIDTSSGNQTTLMHGLNKPHTVLPFNGGYIVAHSGEGEILLVDHNFAIQDKKKFDSWIQDISFFSDSQELLLVADADKSQIKLVELKTWQTVDTYQAHKNWRLSSVSPLS